MRFIKESVIKASPERVFSFHELPDALERLIPPWEDIEVIQKADIRHVGSRAIIKIRILGPIRARWVAEHTIYEPPHVFEDIQVDGPWKYWRHRHFVETHDDGAILRDEIEYTAPFGVLGEFAVNLVMGDKLAKMFDYRHGVTRKWCEEIHPT